MKYLATTAVAVALAVAGCGSSGLSADNKQIIDHYVHESPGAVDQLCLIDRTAPNSARAAFTQGYKQSAPAGAPDPDDAFDYVVDNYC